MRTIVRHVRHCGTSTMGNPTYELSTDDGTFRTQTNGALAYGITNSEAHGGCPIGVPVELDMTRAGRVTNYRRIDNV